MTDRRVQVAARAALLAFLVVGGALSRQPTPVVLLCGAAGLVAAAKLPLDGGRVLPWALVAGAAVTGLCTGSSSDVGWFAVCLLAGWCALGAGPRPALAFTAAAVAVLLVQAVVVEPDPGWASWVAGTCFGLVVCLMARRQQELIEQLRAAQAGLADRVRAEERNHVARELHDVIAHSLTVSLLHVSSARLAVDDDPAEAAEALAQAEELGRQSLREVRHAVGLLRTGAEERDPLPGADQLPALVDGFRRAGADVGYDVVGDPTRLSATSGLTVYRILQESLTNAVRHAGGGRTDVQLHVAGRSAVLTVDSAGPPGAPRPGGVGLDSMRERAEALGGELRAGPSGTGWRVRAVLPS